MKMKIQKAWLRQLGKKQTPEVDLYAVRYARQLLRYISELERKVSEKS